MYLLGLGIVVLVLKYFEIGPVAAWSWWLVLAPFGLAVVWWQWADASGYTKRRAMAREEQKAKARLDRNRAALGQGRGRRG
jgi:small Trp-rich protein